MKQQKQQKKQCKAEDEEDAEVDALVLGEPWWLYQRDAVT